MTASICSISSCWRRGRPAAGRRVDGIGEVPGSVERALEAEAAQGHGVLVCGALHEDAHQVVGDQVHGDFPLDHGRALAAQDFEPEGPFTEGQVFNFWLE